MNSSGKSIQRVPIFVGSTYEDLAEHRRVVQGVLDRLKGLVPALECIDSKPGTPKQELIKALQSCRIYIGMFGIWYGSVDSETGKSASHVEYEEASRLKLPSLIYLLDERNTCVTSGHCEAAENTNRLRTLKAELKNRNAVSYFTSPGDLAMEMTRDLPHLLEEISVTLAPSGRLPTNVYFDAVFLRTL